MVYLMKNYVGIAIRNGLKMTTLDIDIGFAIGVVAVTSFWLGVIVGWLIC